MSTEIVGRDGRRAIAALIFPASAAVGSFLAIQAR
jgi:hypothetical protein